MNRHRRSSTENVLVLGAGQLGAAILDALIPAVTGHTGTVTLLVSPQGSKGRPPEQAEKHRRYQARGVKIITADIASATPASLATIFAAFDTVINCMGFVAGAGTQLTITRAVLQAGVARYFPWQFGVDYDVVGKGSGQPVWDEQYDVRQVLRSQHATDWVIISTGMFTSFLFEPAFGVVNLEQQTIHGLGDWDNRITVTTPEDIGRLTTAIYRHQPEIANQILYLAGDTLSYRQLAELVEHTTGARFTRQLYSVAQLRQARDQAPEDTMLRYRLAFARGDGVWWPMEQTWNARQQIATQDTAHWLRQYLGEDTGAASSL